MLSYLHGFHAGNHADILKHLCLLYTIQYFNKKDKPYSVFDTHSGRGLYDLQDEKALKTGEAARGIGKLLEASETFPESVPQELYEYLNFVKKSLKEGFYPGSPAIEKFFLKEKSNLFLTELHKTEFEALGHNLKKIEKNTEFLVKIENKDGFAFLKASTPPDIKRGFILCDPSYEEKSDYENASSILVDVHKKWCGATILLWYPLLQNRADDIENMKQRILAYAKKQNANTEILNAKLCIDTEDSHVETSLKEAIGSAKPRLYGSGMFVVNPCWGLKEHLEKCLPYLTQILQSEQNGSWAVSLL